MLLLFKKIKWLQQGDYVFGGGKKECRCRGKSRNRFENTTSTTAQTIALKACSFLPSFVHSLDSPGAPLSAKLCAESSCPRGLEKRGREDRLAKGRRCSREPPSPGRGPPHGKSPTQRVTCVTDRHPQCEVSPTSQRRQDRPFWRPSSGL